MEAYIGDRRCRIPFTKIPGARECAIEFRSFSKTAGFTGNALPRSSWCEDAAGPRPQAASKKSLHPLWARRHTTKFNGVSYIVAARRGGALLGRKARSRSRVDSPITWACLASCASRGGGGLRVYGGVNRLTSGSARPRVRRVGRCSTGCSRGECGHHAGQRFRRGWAKLVPHQRFHSRANVEEVAQRIKALKL